MIKNRLLWIASAPSAGDVDLLCVDAAIALKLAGTLEEGLLELRRTPSDVVLLGHLDNTTDERAIEAVRATDSAVRIVIYRPTLSVADAVRLTKLGAFSCLSGPTVASGELHRVMLAVVEARQVAQLAPSVDEEVTEEPWRAMLIGRSRSMEKVAEIIRLVAPRRSTVLITGETGTGKEVVARAIHMASDRRHNPMVAVNCGAIPVTLIEAELFGHVKGAFTGANTNRMGVFERAAGGTIFLDEIGELPFDVQAKLLRVLQEREFQRLGSSETVRVDVRIIAAANIDLEKAVAERRFREDLFYRLNVVPLSLPPLRERGDDVQLLIHHFIGKFCSDEGLPLKRLTEDARQRLDGYHWPGNVRQLEHAVEMAVVLSGGREILTASDFHLPAKRKNAVASSLDLPEGGLNFDEVVGGIERSFLMQALDRCSGNRGKAADLLGLKRTTFLAKLKTFQSAAASSDSDVAETTGEYAFAGAGLPS